MLWETGNWNPWSELARMQKDIDQLFRTSDRRGLIKGDFPAINLWTDQDQGLLTAELPDIDPDKLEITVKNDTLTIRGERSTTPMREGEMWLRRERGEGAFVRSFRLPFQVDAAKVKADYQKGILQLSLPRTEADKPHRIIVAKE